MIDPNNVHLYDASIDTKEEFLLFCISVAGKTAIIQAKKLDDMLLQMKAKYGDILSPFELVRKSVEKHELLDFLMSIKLGQYRRLVSCFEKVSQIENIETVPLETLESIKGIGSKTARFFLLYTRKRSRYAVLDTHILKWMKQQFPELKIPKSTPNSKIYKTLEKVFLDYCDQKGIAPENIDLEIWKGKGKLDSDV